MLCAVSLSFPVAGQEEDDKARCVITAVAKIPSGPGVSVLGSRVTPSERVPEGRAYLVEIDASAAGRSTTFHFGCLVTPRVGVIVAPYRP